MINAKIIADSISKDGNHRVTTFELDYPRYIHAELMTHRVFSRNAASSRAIPIEKVIEQVMDNTVMPLWTQNQSGMQGKSITDGMKKQELNSIWLSAAEAAIEHADALHEAGAHKQNVNRVLEPFQHIKVIVTASDFSNWFELRNHGDAQPEIRALAREMLCEITVSEPKELTKFDWHLPYAEDYLAEVDRTGTQGWLPVAKKISASCCAQVSYRKSDDSIEKAEMVFDRLVTGKPIHASPFEHQCRLMKKGEEQRGNLTGFRQLRQDIEDGTFHQ